MELRVLESVLAIVEAGSFSRAAERLGYSQSALTMQVKQLEAELGVQLFDRVPRGAVLSEEGRAFASHAREVLAAAERAAASVRPGHASAGSSCSDVDPALVTGRLRIGAVESVSAALLPELIVRFHAIHPHVEVVLKTARKEQLLEAVRENELDAFVTLDRPFAVSGAERQVLRTEEVVFAAAPSLAQEAPAGLLSPEELLHLPLVLTERRESYRYELERALDECGLCLEPIVEAGSTDMLMRLAKAGVGVAFLPRFCVEEALEEGTLQLLDVDLEPISMQLQLVHRKSTWPSPQLTTFIDLATTTLS